MRFTLSQRQRLIVAAVYLTALWGIYALIVRTIPHSDEHAVFWFYSAALMVILGRYVVEPFFTTPADAIVNALALLVTLDSLSAADQELLLGFRVLRYYGLLVMAVGAVAIFTKDFRHPVLKTISRSTYKTAELAGKAHVIFSVVYLSASYSFFGRPGFLTTYINTWAFWICATFFDIVGKTVHELTKALRWLRRGVRDELGHAIGCDNPLLYKVEVDYSKYSGREPAYGDVIAIETKANVGALGMVVDRKQLLGKSWLSVYLLTRPSGEVVALDLRGRKLIADPQSIFAAANTAFLMDVARDLTSSDCADVQITPLFAFQENFVGFITKDSDIERVNFIVLRNGEAARREISEGVILKTSIYGDEVLYQVLNGHTREEHLEGFDSHGYTVGLARKLGRYNLAERELETRKWMPGIYTPLFFAHSGAVSPERVKAISSTAIGRLPDTDLEIPLKDLDAIITHNTAILGILGIGKSCLAFELMKKALDAGVKVLCIDITNQYNTPGGLHPYVGTACLDVELDGDTLKALKGSKDKNLVEGNPHDSGNADEYKKAVAADIKKFMESAAKVKLYNPDWHPVSKGVAFKNTSLDDLTIAEKTRVISEQLFVYARSAGESTKAKYLLVLEEAHSLVPEWNSVAAESDKTATNGTAKVILQGRKYGLGSLVITQRTANVSKSILNQCNTVFAMRIFDDTGKNFLENYIGSDFASTLPTLEERHAVAIGKGLRLKQPVIIRLNDRSDVSAVSAPEQRPAP